MFFVDFFQRRKIEVHGGGLGFVAADMPSAKADKQITRNYFQFGTCVSSQFFFFISRFCFMCHLNYVCDYVIFVLSLFVILLKIRLLFFANNSFECIVCI